MLCVCISDDSMKVVLNLELPDADRNMPKKVIGELKGHSFGAINVNIGRGNFNLQHQLDGEAFDEFMTHLTELVKTCNYY